MSEKHSVNSSILSTKQRKQNARLLYDKLRREFISALGSVDFSAE